MGGSALAARYLGRAASPGKLVPQQELLIWRSPVEKAFRLLKSDEAEAKFVLGNVGGTSVRILKVETSCGCATPKIEPTTIAPGKNGTVEVQAAPLQSGEKMVSITLHTDSSLSPTVVLSLRIIGSRLPPFMGQAKGELSFLGDDSATEVRKIFADTVELKGSPPTSPIVKNELPFLEISHPVLEADEPYTTPDTVHRRYVYEAKLASEVPSGSFSGDVFVIDPWDSNHVELIRVHGEALPPLRVFPSRAILRVEKAQGGEGPVAKFMILSKTPALDLVVESEGNEDSPFSVGRLMTTEEGRRTSFSVSLKPGLARSGIFNLVVHRPSSKDRVIVPIAVRAGDDR